MSKEKLKSDTEILALGDALAEALGECLRETFNGMPVQQRREALENWKRVRQ